MRSLIVVAALATLPGRALAHDWYPWDCCSGRDCRPVTRSEVEITATGWRIVRTGEMIPFRDRRIRRTPPDQGATMHWCSRGGRDDGATICLFVPPFGM